ncbi:MAG: acyltransferase [Hyphomicrobiales bacterium]
MLNNTRTISEIAPTGSNSFGVVRLLAASLVVFSHATAIVYGDAVKEPLAELTGHTLGWHSVNMFFCLSGLLIMASMERTSSTLQFLWARFLRLYPAIIALVFFMFGIGAMMSSEPFSVFTFVDFSARILLLFGDSATLPGVFANNPISDTINSPLWTLRFEVFCYLFLALSFTVFAAIKKRVPAFITFKTFSLSVMVICVVHMNFFYDEKTATIDAHMARFVFAFFIGAWVWQWREVLRPSLKGLLILGALNLVLLLVGIHYAPIQIVMASYLALYIGSLNLGALARFTDRQDYSYGVYITGFPIQQIIYVLLPEASPVINFAIAMLIALPISALFWNMIEKPALKLKAIRIDGVIGLLFSDKQKSLTSRLKTQQSRY